MNTASLTFYLKTPILFLIGCGILLPGDDCRAEDAPVIPVAYPADRYEPIWKKSPFTLASAAPESPAGFAENLALGGLIKSDDEYFAVIIDKTTQKRELISSKANAKGLHLVKTEPSDDLAKVSVTLQKDGESQTLRYDMEFLKASAKTQPVANEPNRPPIPQGNPNARPTFGNPPPAIPVSRRRSIPSSRPQPAADPSAPYNLSPGTPPVRSSQ